MASTARIEELRKKYEENQRRYFAPLANEYRKAGQLEEAIALCRAWLPQQPGHMSGHIVFGQTLFEAGELAEARTVFETALELDPENLIALRHLGDIARQHGEVAAARSWYRRVLDADPRNDEIAALLSQLDSSPDDSASPAGSTGDAALADGPAATASLHLEADAASVRLEADLAGSSMNAGVDVAAASMNAGADLPGTSMNVGADLTAASMNVAADMADASLSAEGAAWSGTVQLEDDGPVIVDRALDGAPSLEMETSYAGAHEERTPDAADALFDDAAPGTGGPPERLSVEAEIGISPEGVQASTEVHAGERTDIDAGTEARSVSSGSADAAAPGYAPEAGIQNDVAEERPAAVDAANELGLEVMEFVPPPRNTSSTPAAAVNPFDGHLLTDDTGASGDTPAAFVTETMAELYLQQGFRDEALGVYRQLLQQNPGDDALRERVNQLESGSRSSVGMAAISDEVIESARLRQTAHTPPSMRAFLGRLAGRRAPKREAEAGPAAGVSEAEAGPTAGGSDAEGTGAFDAENTEEAPGAYASGDMSGTSPDAGGALEFEAEPSAPGGDWVAAESEEGLLPDTEPTGGNFPSLDEFANAGAFGSAEPGAGEAEASGSAGAPAVEGTEPAAEFPAWEGSDGDVAAAAQEVPAPGSSSGPVADNGASTTAASQGARGVSGLFPDAVIQAGDEAAASALAAAFAPRQERETGKPLGRPTRAANNEISLDHVFRESGPRPATQKERTNFSFDQFFSEGASTGAAASGEGGKPPAEESSTDDIEQFNSWLEGLKKK